MLCRLCLGNHNFHNGKSKFLTRTNVKTSLGDGRLDVTLTGNEIVKSIKGIDITVTISEWNYTPSNLSFHVTGSAKRSVWPVELKCKAIEKSLLGSGIIRKKAKELLPKRSTK